MLTRDEALVLIQAQNPEPHMIAHGLQTEAVLRALAEHFGEDTELWALTGLLHDVDYPATKTCAEKHGLVAMDLIGDGLPEEALHAIRAHNTECTGVEPVSRLDYALRAGETVTGLIAANALVRPNGMEGMKPKSLKKKMKEKAFAANVDRERIRECEQLDMELGDFFALAITAMDTVAAETGLTK